MTTPMAILAPELRPPDRLGLGVGEAVVEETVDEVVDEVGDDVLDMVGVVTGRSELCQLI